MMKEEYFKNAKKWYNTIYILPASDRLVYIVLFIMCIINSFFAYKLYQSLFPIVRKSNLIIKLTAHDPDNIIHVNRMNKKNPTLSILRVLLKEYITTRESLIYNNKLGTLAIKEKNDIISRLSSKDVYNEYLENIYANNPNSDISYVIKNAQKFIKINNIVFLDTEMRDIEKNLYNKLISMPNPDYAKVSFQVSNDIDDTIKQYNAYITYKFFLPINKDNKLENIQRTVEFYVLGYEKQ